MSENRIKTNEQKKIVKYDIVFFIILNIVMLILHKVTMFDLIKNAIKENQTQNIFLTFLLAFLQFVLEFVLKNWILIVIYIAYRNTKLKHRIHNSKYTEVYGIEYYREKLPKLTASEISLITDLNIENKKDISASLLNLYQKNIIKFENNQIVVTDNNIQNLRNSDKKLIEIVTKQNVNEENVKEWKEICIQEAIEDGYLQNVRKDRYSYLKNINKLIKNAFKVWGITAILLMVIEGVLLIPNVFKESYLNNNTTINKENELYNTQIREDSNSSSTYTYNTQDEMDELILKNPILLVISAIHAVSILVLIYAIIYRKAKMVIVKSDESLQDKYERTEKGNELAEKINGLKKYITDFTMLNQREKEEIVLWEDFLIYAVLLEENEIIIKDIFHYKNINISVLDNIEIISKNIKNVVKSLNASQFADENYPINYIAHVFYDILAKDIRDIKLMNYSRLVFQYKRYSQDEKNILKNDIENILYENNMIDFLKKCDDKYLEFKDNEKLKKEFQEYEIKTFSLEYQVTYEELCNTVKEIGKLLNEDMK